MATTELKNPSVFLMCNFPVASIVNSIRDMETPYDQLIECLPLKSSEGVYKACRLIYSSSKTTNDLASQGFLYLDRTTFTILPSNLRTFYYKISSPFAHITNTHIQNAIEKEARHRINFISIVRQFYQDVMSNEWVLVASERLPSKCFVGGVFVRICPIFEWVDVMKTAFLERDNLSPVLHTAETNKQTSQPTSSDHRLETGPLVNAVLVFNQLLMTTNLFSILPKRSILQLTLVSHDISKLFCHLASEHWIFDFSKNGKRLFKFYSPKKIQVNTAGSLGFFPFRMITHITFSDNFNEPLISLPSSTKHLNFGRSYNQLIPINLEPYKITHLFFGEFYNQRIDVLPHKLTHLTFSSASHFNQTIKTLPSTVTSLIFGEFFNQHINKLFSLTPQLKLLQLGYNYNRPINSLPPSLTHLKLDWCFNQPISQLPHSITHLTFRGDFNQNIDDLLPQSLLQLEFEGLYDQPINSLPPNITHLTLSSSYNQPITKPLPPNLKFLKFGWCYNFPVENILPKGLHTLIFGNNFDIPTVSFPPYLKILSFGGDFDQFLILPEHITHLTFEGKFNKPIRNALPPNITHLKFSNSFNMPIDNLLPAKITHLELSLMFNHPVNHLPPNLISLQLSDSFDHPVNHLPKTLQLLKFYNHHTGSFNQQIHSLPHSLTRLMMGKNFDQPIHHLPPSLTHLKLGSGFNSRITKLPPNLTHLIFEDCYNQPLDSVPSSLELLVIGEQFNQSIVHLPSDIIRFWSDRSFISEYYFYFS